MIDIEKFICSLLVDHPVGVTVREDIHKALKDQGLEYKGGSNEVGWSDKESVWVNADNVEPIPVTAEMLEKNEIDSVFKTRYKGFYLEYHAEARMIMLYVYNNGSFQPTCINFKYVHELQHALRLCGIDEKIIL